MHGNGLMRFGKLKRSEINALVRAASACFWKRGWTLPPKPRWDVTDFGLGDWRRFGLILVNLAEEPEYCEKLMYAQTGMTTPAHFHRVKKEDIICRWGVLNVQIWPSETSFIGGSTSSFSVKVNGEIRRMNSGQVLRLQSGERITLEPGMVHEFVAESAECIIGEVSTANDDVHDNVFFDPEIGRFPGIDEDEPSLVPLISDGG
jgi:hypothetical protein